MSDTKAKVIKTEQKFRANGSQSNGQGGPIDGKENREFSQKPTPAEEVEAARFKALVQARAARRARVHRMMVKLKKLGKLPPAA